MRHKLEIRMPEARNPQAEIGLGSRVEKVLRDWRLEQEHSGFGLGISFGARNSDFRFWDE